MDRNHCLNFGGVETEPPHPQPSQSYNDDDDDRLEDAQAVGAVVISPGYVTDSIAAGELLGTQFGRRWFPLFRVSKHNLVTNSFHSPSDFRAHAAGMCGDAATDSALAAFRTDLSPDLFRDIVEGTGFRVHVIICV